MRPKLLTMTAFGPYGGTEVIDFTTLEEANMFLIHGPTGAGKTTILDAICFALYGQTNGGERTAESMRSKFAKEDQGAEVELVFTVREATYKITRSPRFEIPKKRGTGTTVEEVRATLYKKEGEDYSLVDAKPQALDKKIKELLTSNIDQFRQVIMIAQNKFRELLLAPCKERQKILQDIFETGVYQSVERNLDQLNGKLTNEVREKQLAYENILEHIEHEDHEILKQYLATKVIGNAREVIAILEELKVAKETKVTTNESQLKQLIDTLEVKHKALITATEKYNEYQNRESTQKALSALRKEEAGYEVSKDQ